MPCVVGAADLPIEEGAKLLRGRVVVVDVGCCSEFLCCCVVVLLCCCVRDLLS